MVARGHERVREPGEDAAPVVADLRRLAVHLHIGARHGGPERLPDRLMPETDAEQRRGRAEAAGDVQGHARLVGGAGPGRDDDPLGRHADDRVHVVCVVAHDVQVGAQLAEILHEVVGERIVVVDDEDHDRCFVVAIRIARTRPRALEPVSSHSVLGSESATMPAPTWIEARVPWQTMVRMVMQESRFPEYETYPTAPAYGARWVGPILSLISMARIFGAPLTVPAGKHARSTSKASHPVLSVPTT